MGIFLTGATGYLGAHVAANLLEQSGEELNLLVRGKSAHDAEVRLWHAMQLHLDFPRFYDFLRSRIRVFVGDLTAEQFGLRPNEYDRLVATTDSVIHCAASLNRKSEKSCLNTNLRGTLEVVQLALRAREQHGLRRFSHVSTVAVAGHRKDEVVREDDAIDWNRSDYDPYARTKKFTEHMVRRLLAGTPITIFRPSIVMGDSRRAETTQFDMVRSFVFLAGLPVLPLEPAGRVDIVPVDFVAGCIALLHQKEKTNYDAYHLSSGTGSQTFRQVTDALADARHSRGPMYAPWLVGPFSSVVDFLANRRGTAVGFGASLMKVFLPYLVWNTVFDNTRAVEETGLRPAAFSSYSYPLLRFAKQGNFTYSYRDWPEASGGSAT